METEKETIRQEEAKKVEMNACEKERRERKRNGERELETERIRNREKNK
jgi:hypothetical protein